MGLAEKRPDTAWAVVDSQTAAPSASSEGIIMLMQPASGEELKAVIGYLRQGRMVLILLEQVPLTQTRRMVDFLGGAAYGLNCQLQRVARNLYLLLPAQIQFTDETATD
mgnify:CR=1 FL=1